MGGKKIDKEKKIHKFGRYVDDSLGIYKGKKMELEKKMKELENKEKLKLEVENKNKITFLDIKLKKKMKKVEKWKPNGTKKKRVWKYTATEGVM